MTPEWLGRPLSIGSGLLALAGALLVFAATAYGSWLVLLPAAAVFAGAALCWHVADRVASNRH